jgi:IPT/TIG domain
MLKYSLQYCCSLLALLGLLALTGCKKDEVIPTPANLELTPAEALPGALVTIKGSGLADIQTILFGEVTAPFNPVFNTDAALLIRVPANAKFGAQKITLLNKGGDAKKVQLDFKVLQSPPLVRDFKPSEGAPGDTITITGEVFDNLESVKFGELVATIISKTTTEIKVRVPDGVEKAPITVTTAGGSKESTNSFAPKGLGLFIFDDEMKAPWQSWSWAKVTMDDASHIKTGKKNIKVGFPGWSALWFNTGSIDAAIDASKFTTLKFWVHGGEDSDEKKLQIFYRDEDKAEPEAGKGKVITVKKGEWQEVTLQLKDLGAAKKIKGIIFQEFGNAGDQGPVYFDDIKLQ